MIKALVFDCFGVFYPDPVLTYMHDPKSPPDKAEILHSYDERAARGQLAKNEFIKKQQYFLINLKKKLKHNFSKDMIVTKNLLSLLKISEVNIKQRSLAISGEI